MENLIINLNSVKDILIKLGYLQGFDLTDPNVSKAINYKTGDRIWLRNYNQEEDWEQEFKRNFKEFYYHMTIYKMAIDNYNLKDAAIALLQAKTYAANLSNIFCSIKDDISTLLSAKYKTNNFAWPLSDD